MSDQAGLQHANMQQNVERGLYFLRLATEQARILSPTIATHINNHCLPELLNHFDQAVKTETIGSASTTALNTLAREGNESMAALQNISDKTPLGFGGAVVTERMTKTPPTTLTNRSGCIGSERERMICEQKVARRKNQLLAELVDSSER